MKHQSASLLIRVVIALAIGFACYLSLQQPARAGNSLSTPVFASPVPGNLMVYRVGDGRAALTTAATAVFVDEYTTSGAFVQSIAMPTAVSGSQRRLTASGSALTEGFLTLSEDLQYLVLTGYDADVATASVAGTSSATTNRVIGRLDILGNVDTSTVINDTFSGANIRSAASDSGTRFWATGSANGVRYVLFGSGGTSSSVSTTFTNLRQIKIGRGQLYVSANTGTLRLGTVGTGLPITSGQVITNLSGITTTVIPNSFYFADLDAGVAGFDTLYLADEGGTIQKYSLVSGSWTANGTVALTGARGLTGIHTGSTVTLYATSTSILSALIDASGYNATIVGTPTTLATAGANTAFRGVAFAPGTSPTAVHVATLSARPADSTLLVLLTVLGLTGLASLGYILRRRSRAA